MVVVRFFQKSPHGCGIPDATLTKLQSFVNRKQLKIAAVKSEVCYHIELTNDALAEDEERVLKWILAVSFDEICLSSESFLEGERLQGDLLMEYGPRLNFSTAFSTNAVSIASSVGLSSVKRLERARRYLLRFDGGKDILNEEFQLELGEILHDKMTECLYEKPPTTFDLEIQPQPVFEVDIMGRGKEALVQINQELGLAMDEWDLNYYSELFKNSFQRNPTSVECFDLAQSNSEHSRHWFFRGKLVVDGEDVGKSLMGLVKGTQSSSNQNNVIKFEDNSSAIEGFSVPCLVPKSVVQPGSFQLTQNGRTHITFTAETHNFPTGVAPFPGATTGTGGRIRDNQATGRGAHVIAGTAGYCFGNLQIPGYSLPWEDEGFEYPSNFAKPLEVAVEASNGASDYGNKFGEPMITGFARSFGQLLNNGERKEWIKPIMFSGGIGSLSDGHVKKFEPEVGMDVLKVGGPVYRIGVGGGAASSVQIQGDNKSELDFSAVQRGDAEMEQKMNRFIRACIELGELNPICSIQDQGAGGNGNVLKEICSPSGAVIRLSGFQLGDPTLSVMDIWGAEYQESNALLVRASDAELLKGISKRERCPVSFVGSITNDGRVKLKEDRNKPGSNDHLQCPVDLDLKFVLADMPQKVYKLDRQPTQQQPLCLPQNITLQEALERVLRLPSVASKRYLVNKVDRSVTGLVAQQQCVGPLHTPLADVAVIALSHFDTVGGATAIGEQPIKCLVDPCAGARMCVGEALTNMVFAQITDVRDVKCSANWMWPGKLGKEGARLYDACLSMCNLMKQLGIAVDGGKDSLSMSARLGKEVINAPGNLVISAYAPCEDVRATVTPDLKCPNGRGVLLHVPLCPGKYRLGGSALAQCYGQIGDASPDLESPEYFVNAFRATQRLIKESRIVSGHDVSDGGLITCMFEMAFAGNCSIDVNVKSVADASLMQLLFAEELGLVLEVQESDVKTVQGCFSDAGVVCVEVGSSYRNSGCDMIRVCVDGKEILKGTTSELRHIWEETSFQLEKFQNNHKCVEQEEKSLKERKAPKYHLAFNPAEIMARVPSAVQSEKPKVAVIREEGSNGDREMISALYMAGFEPWDINMEDVCSNSNCLDDFRGIVFVGGFSYGDVLGSAKGWAATIKFNQSVRSQFEKFVSRPDTFSLGVCNGCQLMALLGWVGLTESDNSAEQGVVLGHNESGKFESRFTTVKIVDSPSIMLAGMHESVLGVWVAHGEGQMVFKNQDVMDAIMSKKLSPLRYVDDDGEPTTVYPYNPNGSPAGIAGLCSPDGRHLAMMPHPERCVRMWQWPWMPEDWKKMETSPWLCMFKNAFDWCVNSN